GVKVWVYKGEIQTARQSAPEESSPPEARTGSKRLFGGKKSASSLDSSPPNDEQAGKNGESIVPSSSLAPKKGWRTETKFPPNNEGNAKKKYTKNATPHLVKDKPSGLSDEGNVAQPAQVNNPVKD
ncbi:MAG: hypothetical protein QM520_05925, partial [Gammaproteobacteria bacterium]|nr:hypothetical protein [Gammaproteobacteria bacterium]